MPNNRRKPYAQAVLDGSAAHNPKRYEGRSQPAFTGVLGDPPEWMGADQISAWHETVAEIPWLEKSDRAMMELTSVLRARVKHPKEREKINLLRELRQCLQVLGATPSHKSSVPQRKNDEPSEFDYFEI